MELEWSSTWFWCQWNHKKSLHWSIKWLQWVCNSFWKVISRTASTGELNQVYYDLYGDALVASDWYIISHDRFSTKIQNNSYSQVTRHTKDQWSLGQYPSKGHFSILIQNGTRINSKVATFEIFFHSSHSNLQLSVTWSIETIDKHLQVMDDKQMQIG